MENVVICQSYTSMKTMKSKRILLLLIPNLQGPMLLTSAWSRSPHPLSGKALGW